MTKTRIKVTDDKQMLYRIWGQEYADEHAGKEYDALLMVDGWVIVCTEKGDFKFPKHAYEVIK